MKTMLKTLAATAAAFLFVSGQMAPVHAATDDITACDEHKGEDKAGKADEKGKGCSETCKKQCESCGKCGTAECKCDKGCADGCKCDKK